MVNKKALVGGGGEGEHDGLTGSKFTISTGCADGEGGKIFKTPDDSRSTSTLSRGTSIAISIKNRCDNRCIIIWWCIFKASYIDGVHLERKGMDIAKKLLLYTWVCARVCVKYE